MLRNSWAWGSLIIGLLIFLPILFIIIPALTKPNENWNHIQTFLLPEIVQNSLVLLVGSAFLTGFIGITLAWIISVYDFPWRRFFSWALIMPLAIPTYIGAYTYHGMLNYTGIVQTTLRNQFDITLQPEALDIMNRPGAIFIFTLFLYPYVYTLTRTFFQRQATSLLENARVLGRKPWEVFLRVALPLSRTALVGGITLVCLEVLNDYGVSKYFGIQTFTTAIFQTWFAMGDLQTAIQLAVTLMATVLFCLLLERILRGRMQYSATTTKTRILSPQRLTGVKKWGAFTLCLVVFLVAFFLPLIQLIYWTYLAWEEMLNPEFYQLVWSSVWISAVGALLIVILSFVIANFRRLERNRWVNLLTQIVLLGYSIPGAVIAIAVISFFLAIDKQLVGVNNWLSLDPPLVLSTTIIMLLFAHVIRFLAIGYQPIDTGFEKLGNRYTEASRTLGMSSFQTFWRIDLPLVRGAMVSGAILAFIDILKELPLTLLLQPFNFYTLSTKAFQFAKDEMIHEAAFSSILMILISAIAIWILATRSGQEGT